jgi:hypothetical protein
MKKFLCQLNPYRKLGNGEVTRFANTKATSFYPLYNGNAHLLDLAMHGRYIL